MSSEQPPSSLLRGDKIMVVRYGFGDASGNGFGATWNKQKSSDISYRFGIWDEEDNDGRSSNYWELTKLVETLEELDRR